MASRHQTFKQGQVLQASDMNDCLNPATADHIPYAVYATTFDDGRKTGGAYARNLTFPTGRFKRPPVVQVTLNNASEGADKTVIGVSNISATGCRIHFLPIGGANLNAQCAAAVTAIQMEK